MASEKIKRELTQKALAKAENVMEKGSTLDKFILSWCLENFVFLKKEKQQSLPENLHMISYENLVNEPGKCIRTMCEKLKITYEPRMLEKVKLPSHGIVHSTDDTKAQIIEGKNKQLLEKWRQKISPQEEEKAFSILDAFGIDLYRKGENFPLR
jgi:hypothetical protein